MERVVIKQFDKDMVLKEEFYLYFQKSFFQATIDCLSVPRCHGNLLKMLCYFVLTTATTLKQTRNICPNLDVTSLEGCVKGRPGWGYSCAQ